MNGTYTNLSASTHRCFAGAPYQVGKYLTTIDEVGRFFEPVIYSGQPHGAPSSGSFLSVVDDFGSLRVVHHYLPASH